MKVLGYVHTFNDAEVIDGTIRALCEQTYPIPEILLVDNASTDATLHRTSPPLGTNGHSSSETVRRPRDTSPKIHRYVAPVSASTRSKRVPTLG